MKSYIVTFQEAPYALQFYCDGQLPKAAVPTALERRRLVATVANVQLSDNSERIRRSASLTNSRDAARRELKALGL